MDQDGSMELVMEQICPAVVELQHPQIPEGQTVGKTIGWMDSRRRLLHSPIYFPLERVGTISSQVQFIDASHQNQKSRYFLWNDQNVLCVDLSIFNQSYSGGITTTKKPTVYWRYYVPFKMSASYSCHGTRQASTPWATSLYFKFRAIYLWLLNEFQWWDQAKIYHIIRQLSHRFMCEIMIWSGDKTKLIHKKTFPQDYDYELLNLSKTKIPITIVKAQMPSNPNQKSRTRDNKLNRLELNFQKGRKGIRSDESQKQ